MEDNLLKIVRKFLVGNTFDIDGYKYRFVSVEHLEFYSKTTFKFEVNVDTPVKGQSYVVAKMDGDIQNILINLWKYFGAQFSYSIDKIYVNGKNKDDKDIYVSPQKEKELFTTLNNSKLTEFTKTVHWLNQENLSKLSCNVAFRPTKEHFYYLSDVNMTFQFALHVSNFKENGVSIYPNMDKIDELGTAMSETFNDSDNFRSQCEDIIYNVLEPEFKVGMMDDLYYYASFIVTKIDGIDTAGDTWGVYLDRSQFT